MDDNFMLKKWYAKENDLIGGWCVMPVDATPGESNMPEIADFCKEAAARHIAFLHNNWIETSVEIRAA